MRFRIFETSVFLSAKTSEGVQDATASETDPSAPGIAGRKQDTGNVDPSAPGSNKRKTTKKLRRGAKKIFATSVCHFIICHVFHHYFQI